MSTKKLEYTIPVEIPDLKFYNHGGAFELESGHQLPELTIAYHTYGQLNEKKDNVLWICHALTANSHAADWWGNLFAPDKIFNTEKYFIVCANILGSCYGTTCPRSINPETGEAYGLDFPAYTIRDMAKAHFLLFDHLKLNSIAICMGGSCGGHQVMEMAYAQPEKIKKMIMLVTSSKEAPAVIAGHEAQRLAIEADSTWKENRDDAGQAGLRAARGMALLGYRTTSSYNERQKDLDGRTDEFRAASYIQYQGTKLVKRFYTHAYYYLLKALDTHHMGRQRGDLKEVLASVKIPGLIIGINTDILIPTVEQQFIATHMPNVSYEEITSKYGHDGFLIEAEQINSAIQGWLSTL